MGTRVAPSYANIFMGEFENKYIYTYPKQPLFWLRYIDDIFMIWDDDIQGLEKFIDHINTCHHSIKFTHEISEKSVSFLDVKVTIDENNNIQTTLHTKKTDTHNYLRYDSAHSKSCKNGIPYG